MKLPPGFFYILSLLPYFTIPSGIVFYSFKLLQVYYTNVGVIPTWAIILVAAAARPVIFYLGWYYRVWSNQRKAAANGAVLAPHIKESALKIIPELIQSNNYPGTVLHRLSKVYGNTFQLSLLTSSKLVTFEPDHIKAMLATQFGSFGKGPTFISQLNSLLGTGVFNSDGDMWKFHRAMTRPFFTRERITEFDTYDRNCELSIKAVKERIKEGYSFNFQDLAARFTLDSASEFLFGNNVGSLSAGIPYPIYAKSGTEDGYYAHPSTIFAEAFLAGQVRSDQRFGLGNDWPLAELWKDEVKPFRKVVDKFIEPLMQEALEKRERDVLQTEKSPGTEGADVTLLSHLVRHTQDQKTIKDELVNLMVAGRDTTSSLLTFSLYMLTQHPDIEKRLRQEIFDKVGPSARPTYEHMRDMKLMRAFLNEVLRLYPPVTGNMRTPNKDVYLPSKREGQPPLFIPANTTCMYSVMIMQRRTDLWGPDALEFDPDRFLDERLHKYLVPNPFIFCPFSAGARICLGQQFAYHEATFYLVRLLQNFKNFSLDQKANTPPPAHWANEDDLKAREKIFPLSHLTLYVKDGLWVNMEELSHNDM